MKKPRVYTPDYRGASFSKRLALALSGKFDHFTAVPALDIITSTQIVVGDLSEDHVATAIDRLGLEVSLLDESELHNLLNHSAPSLGEEEVAFINHTEACRKRAEGILELLQKQLILERFPTWSNATHVALNRGSLLVTTVKNSEAGNPLFPSASDPANNLLGTLGRIFGGNYAGLDLQQSGLPEPDEEEVVGSIKDDDLSKALYAYGMQLSAHSQKLMPKMPTDEKGLQSLLDRSINSMLDGASRAIKVKGLSDLILDIFWLRVREHAFDVAHGEYSPDKIGVRKDWQIVKRPSSGEVLGEIVLDLGGEALSLGKQGLGNLQEVLGRFFGRK